MYSGISFAACHMFAVFYDVSFVAAPFVQAACSYAALFARAFVSRLAGAAPFPCLRPPAPRPMGVVLATTTLTRAVSTLQGATPGAMPASLLTTKARTVQTVATALRTARLRAAPSLRVLVTMSAGP